MGSDTTGLRLLAVAATLTVAACGEPVEVACDSSDEALCGRQNPEDVAVIPNTDVVMVSEMVADDAKRGSLTAWRTGSREQVPVEIHWDTMIDDPKDPTCPIPDPDAFQPHGIDFGSGDDGLAQMAVINHGGERDTVEFFDVELAEDHSSVTLSWHGCLQPPYAGSLNDVSLGSPGHVFFTNIGDTKATATFLFKMMLGMKTGYVWHWNGDHYSIVDGSEGSFPNGVLASNIGSIYVSYARENEVRKMSVSRGKVDEVWKVPVPDNLVYFDQRVWVTSVDSFADLVSCPRVKKAKSCGVPFSVKTFATRGANREVRTVYQDKEASFFGAPSVAQPVVRDGKTELWIGSFAGDRVAIVPIGTP